MQVAAVRLLLPLQVLVQAWVSPAWAQWVRRGAVCDSARRPGFAPVLRLFGLADQLVRLRVDVAEVLVAFSPHDAVEEFIQLLELAPTQLAQERRILAPRFV